MSSKIPESISWEEFDKRLNAHNVRAREALIHAAHDEARIEEILTQIERTLDEFETQLRDDQFGLTNSK